MYITLSELCSYTLVILGTITATIAFITLIVTILIKLINDKKK